MNLIELCDFLLTPQRKKALTKSLTDPDILVTELSGLAGSSAPMMMAALPKADKPMIVVGDSLDDAGYLYHDLTRILGEEAVAMLPSP